MSATSPFLPSVRRPSLLGQSRTVFGRRGVAVGSVMAAFPQESEIVAF
jgi:hypothetical protein